MWVLQHRRVGTDEPSDEFEGRRVVEDGILMQAMQL
jgi:hypothetical protein